MFSDLPKIKSGEGSFGIVKYSKPTTNYLEKTQIRNCINFTTQHIARYNNENDLEIYRIAVEKWINYQTKNEILIDIKIKDIFIGANAKWEINFLFTKMLNEDLNPNFSFFDNEDSTAIFLSASFLNFKKFLSSSKN